MDLLKNDCEDPEYEMLMRAPKVASGNIKKIRMELHPSRIYARADLVRHFKNNGFYFGKQSGMIYWFERK